MTKTVRVPEIRDLRSATAYAAIEEKGFRTAAREAHEREEALRQEHAERNIIRLVHKLFGHVEATPFVLDDFDNYAPRSRRVCVNLDGIVLNYRPANQTRSDALLVVAGRCTECGNVPLLKEVQSLADVGEFYAPSYQRFADSYRCPRCKEARA